MTCRPIFRPTVQAGRAAIRIVRAARWRQYPAFLLPVCSKRLTVGRLDITLSVHRRARVTHCDAARFTVRSTRERWTCDIPF